jgi:hypothetical protein
MGKLKNIISEAFRNAVLSEARNLPSDSDIASCPSIYKAIRSQHLESYIEHGFQHQLAGDGGTMRGEGVYALSSLVVEFVVLHRGMATLFFAERFLADLRTI